MHTMDHLLSLLGAQRDILSRLLELAREERRYIFSNQLPDLESVVQQQMELLSKQTRLSGYIAKLLPQYAEPLHLHGRITLARLAEELPGADGAKVSQLYRELTSLADQLQREGRINWHLAQQALGYIDFTLKLIGRARESTLPYEPNSHTGPVKPVQLLMDSCA